MRFRVIPMLTALVLGAGCMEAEPPVGEVDQEIIGGSRIPGQDMGAVFIMARTQANALQWLCSGALISPRVVMTAAHCVDVPANKYEVYFIDKWDPRTRQFTGQVDDVIRTSQVVFVHPLWDDSNLAAGNDIALVLLDKAAPASVTPLEYSRYRPTRAWIDLPVRMIGFGLTVASSFESMGEKLQGLSKITGVVQEYLSTFGLIQTCQGDSGGPLLVSLEGREVVAGVTSFGGSGCSSQSAGYTRVDRHLAYVRQFIAQHDPQPARNCGADGTCGVGCDAVDPDCPCVGDGFCTSACMDPDLDPDCPLNCRQDSVCQRNGCAVPDPDCGDKLLGDTCARNEECVSALCVPSGSARVCADRCDPGNPCADGFTCSSNRVCLTSAGGGGCSVGGDTPRSRGGVGGGLLALLAAVLWRSRRPRGQG
jgi:hypothetical protein